MTDIASFLKSTTDTQQAVAGINAEKALKFQVGTGFSWRDPPLSLFGYLFPSDSTYHPLLNSTNYEIATNLFSVEGSGLPDSEKTIYKNKIKDIVMTAPRIKAMGKIYLMIIVFAIILLLGIIFTSYDFMSSGALLLMFVGMCILTSASYLITMFDVDGDGYRNWYQFESAYNAAQASGSTPQHILEKMKMDEHTEQELHAKYQAVNMPNNSSLAGSALAGIVVGSLMNFGKK